MPASHQTIGPEQTEAIGSRSSTDTIVSPTVTIAIVFAQRFIVAISAGPTPRWPSTPSRAVATWIACPTTDRIRK